MSTLAAGLRAYTRLAPFHRGRGAFIRPIELLKRRGWPPPLITIAPNLMMEFEPSLLGWTLFERGEWEPAQTAAFLELVRPGAVVLDVGANTGYYALLAAHKGAQVHAFEIQPDIAAILRRNVVRNGLEASITVVEQGCFSSEGEAAIEHRGDAGSARVDTNGRGVPLTTVDAYAARAGLEHVDVILIDTEGADFEVLKGAAGVLARSKPAVMAEAHHLGAFGGSEEAMRGYMADHGYEGRTLYGEFSTDLLFLP